MPKELYPSSYECDCGHVSHFSESTINAMKQMSLKKKVCLADSDNPSHCIYFFNGEMVEIKCPRGGRKEKRKRAGKR